MLRGEWVHVFLWGQCVGTRHFSVNIDSLIFSDILFTAFYMPLLALCTKEEEVGRVLGRCFFFFSRVIFRSSHACNLTALAMVVETNWARYHRMHLHHVMHGSVGGAVLFVCIHTARLCLHTLAWNQRLSLGSQAIQGIPLETNIVPVMLQKRSDVTHCPTSPHHRIGSRSRENTPICRPCPTTRENRIDEKQLTVYVLFTACKEAVPLSVVASPSVGMSISTSPSISPSCICSMHLHVIVSLRSSTCTISSWSLPRICDK